MKLNVVRGDKNEDVQNTAFILPTGIMLGVILFSSIDGT